MRVAGCFSPRWALPALVVGFALLPVVGTAQTASTRQVTFNKDVAPIFNRSCVRCHRPEEIAPMSLLTYNDARPWARSIKERVSKREMPPWFLDKTIGIQKYKEDPSLTDEEVATIVNIPVNTVKTRMHVARKHLAQLLAAEGYVRYAV